ncbi:50S ribosomal protein L32 [Candidatus Poribacteria bacterium]|nr:50S ribosomal protein L32 [Candidatus Poribacteria bacterium]
MALPKRRLSKSRRGNRRAHLALRVRLTNVCPKCQAVKLPHRACPECGYYKGRQVINVKEQE